MPVPNVTLHDLARYYRHGGLVGEDRAAITSTVALGGGASVIWLGYPGTGKTHGARISAALVVAAAPHLLVKVDMLSKLGIWSPGMVKRIEAIGPRGVVLFPEDQNASDNDENVKVKKKWGDGDDAERAKSEDMGNDTSFTVLPCRTFLSTAAITNAAFGKSFDLESSRRVVKVATDPSETATSAVLDSQADALVYGSKATNVLSPLEKRAVEKRVAAMMESPVERVRFFGAHAIKNAIPAFFPEARSANALFAKILLGVARWYADSEVTKGTTVYLSPQRAAEAWAFYGDVLDENARKFETSDREILGAYPQPVWNGEAIAPECALDLPAVMRKLRPMGLTDPALVKRQISKLVTKGFLAEADGFSRARWHRTTLSDVANRVEWRDVLAECRKHAKTQLDGDERAAYLAKCDEAESVGMMNPITGQVGPIVGDESVLYFDRATGKYAPVGERKGAAPRGILAY